jgi:hypothetical protein
MNSNKTVQANFTQEAQALPVPTITTPSNNQVFPSNTNTVRVEWEDEGTNYLVRYKERNGSKQQIDTYTLEYIDINVQPGESYDFWIHTGVVDQGPSGWSNPSTDIQFSVADGSDTPTDSDNDGVIDSLDRCPNTPSRIPSNRISPRGCPRPVHNNLRLNLNLEDISDLRNVSNLEIEDEDRRYGKITFLEPVDLTFDNDSSETTLDDLVTISEGTITIDDSSSFANTEAEISIEIDLDNPVLYRDGQPVPENEYSYENGVLMFRIN